MKSRSVSIPSQRAISILLRSSTRPPQQPCPQAGNNSTFLRTTAQSTSRNGPCHARRRIARSPSMPQQPHAVCNLRQSPDVPSRAQLRRWAAHAYEEQHWRETAPAPTVVGLPIAPQPMSAQSARTNAHPIGRAWAIQVGKGRIHWSTYWEDEHRISPWWERIASLIKLDH